MSKSGRLRCSRYGFLGLLHASEFAERRVARLLGRHSTAKIFFRQQIYMRAQFIFQVAFQALPKKQRPHP